jgi:hypothetical protein
MNTLQRGIAVRRHVSISRVARWIEFLAFALTLAFLMGSPAKADKRTGRSKHAPAQPGNDPDRRIDLRVGALLCIAVSSARRRSVTASSRCRQNLPTPPVHSRSREVIASLSDAVAAVTAGVTRDARDARDVVASAMLTLAKPIPAVTAKANVIIHTDQAAAVPHWRACQAAAAHDGTATGRRDRRPRQSPGTASRRSRSTRATGRTSS